MRSRSRSRSRSPRRAARQHRWRPVQWPGGAAETVHIHLVEDGGAQHSVALSRPLVSKIPALDAMCTTEVGRAAADAKDLHLPPKCTIGAFLALVTHIDVGEDEYLRPEWKATGAALASLLYTADFLLLDSAVEELVQHCVLHAKSWPEADVAQMLALTIPNEAITNMQKGLVGILDADGANVEGLVDEMATTDIVVNGKRLRILAAWLGHQPHDADVRNVLGWLPWTVLWDRRDGCMRLKDGSTDLVEAIAGVGVDRPQLFDTVVETLFWCSRWKVTFEPDELRKFMAYSFGTLWSGRCLSPEELDVLFKKSMSMPYTDGFCGSYDVLPVAIGAAREELQKAALDCLMQSPRFPEILSVPLLTVLPPSVRSLAIARVLMVLKECSQAVQTFIVNAVANREL